MILDQTYILGVDLAQASDYTALCVLERTQKHVRDGHRLKLETHYAVPYLERLAKGTPYPVQVERIKALSDRLRTDTEQTPNLVVDQTGVGRPVVDMLRSAGLSPAAVTITGGDNVSRDGLEYRVPKRDLVSVIQVLLQSDRLKIARALPEASTLTGELHAFKVSISLKGHDSYGNDAGQWRENPHDDLVLALALGAWYAEKALKPTGAVVFSAF